jgi:type IV secretory pathway VirB6-like protein
MLQPMKFCLFFTSYIYSSFIYFAWQFGSQSCAFTDPFYGKSWVLPWWTIIIFNSVIFLHLACVTFPAYSLAVQMGSNLKGHMLPSRFVKKLLKAVDDAKREVEEEERLKRDRQGDAADGRLATFNRLFRRSAEAILSKHGESS